MSHFREADDEGGAFAQFALDAYLAFVGFHHLHHIVQSDAESLDVVPVACGDAVEVLEDMTTVFFRDAYSVVGDAQAYVFAVEGGGDGDGGVLG